MHGGVLVAARRHPPAVRPVARPAGRRTSARLGQPVAHLFSVASNELPLFRIVHFLIDNLLINTVRSGLESWSTVHEDCLRPDHDVA